MCRFSKQLTSSPVEVLDRVRRGLDKYGGGLQGDERAGTLRAPTPLGTIEGSYRERGTTLEIQVDRKPRLLPCSAIEAVIDRFL